MKPAVMDLRKPWTINGVLPTVFSNAVVKWPCFNWGWRDWAKNCGALEFKFRCAPIQHSADGPQWEADAEVVNATLEHFLQWITSTNVSYLDEDNPLKKIDRSDKWCYSSYNYMNLIFSEKPVMFDILDWSDFGLVRNGKDSTLWIGSKHSYTPCHQDTYGCNLVAQIIGRKLWILYPPSDTDNMYPTRIPYEESSVFSSVNIVNPNLSKHTKFTKCTPYVVVLEPGQVLFVPPKWWHYVHCLSDSLSINTWVEMESDTDGRIHEALVRTMLSALVPKYKPQKEEWLNPNESFMSEGETSDILLHVLGSSKVKGPEITSLNSNLEQNKWEVLPVQKQKLRKLLLEHEIPNAELAASSSVSSLENSSVTMNDVVNCMVHPSVIALIAKLLEEK